MEDKVIIRGAIFEDQCICFSDEVKNVGVWLDKHLNLNTHVNKIVSLLQTVKRHWQNTISAV